MTKTKRLVSPSISRFRSRISSWLPASMCSGLIDQGIVSIYNADGTRPQGIIMGWAAYRVDAGDKKLFTVSEPEGSQPATLKYWFYPGDNVGIEFSAKKPASET